MLQQEDLYIHWTNLHIIVDFDKLIEYQRFMQKSIISEDRLDRKIELLSIINQLTAGPKNMVQKEQVMVEATAQGFSDIETISLLDSLKDEGIISESDGYIRKR